MSAAAAAAQALTHGAGGGDAVLANVIKMIRNARLPFWLAPFILLLSMTGGAAALDCGSAAAAEATLTPCLSFAKGGDPTPVCCVPLAVWEDSGWGLNDNIIPHNACVFFR
jgi:hypothetical protein